MAVTASILSTAVSVASAVVDASSKYMQEEQKEKENRYNEGIARDDAARTYAEYAMNAGLKRASARKDIAGAANQLAASGNVGSSADAALMDAYLNLSSDLSAMKYQYDNTAIKYLNEAENYKYNKEVAKYNKAGAKLAGYLNVAKALGTGYMMYSFAGGQYGFTKLGALGDAAKAQTAVEGAAVDWGQAKSAANWF